MIWKCRLWRVVHAPNGAFDLDREIELPFVPVPGLHLVGVFHEGDSIRIGSVSWRVSEGVFDVYDDGDDEVTLVSDFAEEAVEATMRFGVTVDGASDMDSWRARRRGV